MKKLVPVFPSDMELVCVRLRRNATCLLGICEEGIYMIQWSPTREDVDHAAKLLSQGLLTMRCAGGKFPLTRIPCEAYTIIETH